MLHSEMHSGSKPVQSARWPWITASLVLGLAAAFWVVKEAGVRATRDVVVGALPWLPWVLALEGFRVATETLAARSLFRLLKARIPTGAIIRAQLVGYAICNVVPVGRVACEATKANILKSHAPLPKTAAAAVITQALHLLASAIILVPCVVAARSARSSAGLSLTIVGQCVLLAGIGGALLLVCYFAPLGVALGRLPKVGAALEEFRSAMRQLPRFPLSALGWLVLNRFLQVALIAILIRAVGSEWSLRGAFVAQAVLLVGASAGDMVPGQIGALEGAFTFFAASMGTTRPHALAIALLVHLVQSAWVVVGFATLGLGRNHAHRLRSAVSPRTAFSRPLGATSALKASP